jgi:hypothetical protein
MIVFVVKALVMIAFSTAFTYAVMPNDKLP